VTAVRTRAGFVSAFGWLRSSGERKGVTTGPAGRWTYAHRHALRICAVGLAAIVFVFQGRPTAASVIVLVIVLLVVLGLIELIGRPPAKAEIASQT
jgi:fatty acid desaturase